ncbi:MAG: hypothetical protein HHAS10_03440 [Candidatus Altimarinota bacterium]
MENKSTSLHQTPIAQSIADAFKRRNQMRVNEQGLVSQPNSDSLAVVAHIERVLSNHGSTIH